MTQRTTKVEIEEQVNRLGAVYGLPSEATAADTRLRWAEEWVRALEPIDIRAIRAAVDAYLASPEKYFPRPGRIRTDAIALLARFPDAAAVRDASLDQRYLRWEASGWRTPKGEVLPCPVCGATPVFEPRIHVPHDAAKHRAAGVRVLS